MSFKPEHISSTSVCLSRICVQLQPSCRSKISQQLQLPVADIKVPLTENCCLSSTKLIWITATAFCCWFNIYVWKKKAVTLKSWREIRYQTQYLFVDEKKTRLKGHFKCLTSCDTAGNSERVIWFKVNILTFGASPGFGRQSPSDTTSISTYMRTGETERRQDGRYLLF